MRRKLIWYSVVGGAFLTLLAIVLRFAGINWPVPYLTYPGAYLMQTFFQRFLEWIPWQYADNLISELLLFFALKCFGLRLRDFSSAPNLFSGSFFRTASLDWQKITVISGGN